MVEASFNLLHSQIKAPLLSIILLIESLVLPTQSNHVSEAEMVSVMS